MYKEKKLNIKNLWCTKNEINFFVPDTNEILFIYLFCFWHVIIFFLLRDNKNISPAHNIQMMFKRKICCYTKNNSVVTKTSWCCTKKCFMSTKKVDVAQKKVFHVNKNKTMLHQKNILYSKNLLIFPQRRAIDILCSHYIICSH